MQIRFEKSDSVFEVSLKPASFTVMKNSDTLFSYDRMGRLLGCFINKKNYRRGLNNSFQIRYRGYLAMPIEEVLPENEAKNIVEAGRHVLTELLSVVHNGKNKLLRDMIVKSINFSWEELKSDGTRFRKMSGEVPILPPDQYRSVVLRITEGCSHNACSFCNLYKNLQFRTIPKSQFRLHLDRVAEFFGAGLSYRRSIFLGDANAITISTSSLIDRIEIISAHSAFQQQILGGFGSFIDVFTGTRKSSEEYKELKKFGLNRVAPGVETGYENLLNFVNKPGTNAEVIDLTISLKSANISVTPIFLIGLGGIKFKDEHREQSLKLIKELPLDNTDIIYLSRFTPSSGSRFESNLKSKNIDVLSEENFYKELKLWKSRLKTIPAKVVSYNFTRFVY
jgi:radical SAM superfamily enzyme YgiQ (UPF0313 family)